MVFLVYWLQIEVWIFKQKLTINFSQRLQPTLHFLGTAGQLFALYLGFLYICHRTKEREEPLYYSHPFTKTLVKQLYLGTAEKVEFTNYHENFFND